MALLGKPFCAQAEARPPAVGFDRIVASEKEVPTVLVNIWHKVDERSYKATMRPSPMRGPPTSRQFTVLHSSCARQLRPPAV
jgi:hypothetical protein